MPFPRAESAPGPEHEGFEQVSPGLYVAKENYSVFSLQHRPQHTKPPETTAAPAPVPGARERARAFVNGFWGMVEKVPGGRGEMLVDRLTTAIEAHTRDLAAEVERVWRHANEGWELANYRTRQWKSAEAEISRLTREQGELRAALERAAPFLLQLEDETDGPTADIVDAFNAVDTLLTRYLTSTPTGAGGDRDEGGGHG